MRQMDELRPATLDLAEGEVLEVGFGTGLNLAFYGPGVKALVALDPNPCEGFAAFEERLARVDFDFEHSSLRADRSLPFEDARFDCAVSTWTLCSIPDPEAALREIARVLKPGGRLLFIEHGRDAEPGVARWQDRLNPLWVRISDGCHMNRSIDRIVEAGGFELESLERFRHKGPRVLAHMYRGVARRAERPPAGARSPTALAG
jgi:SAM-dependent methyltransferase